MKLSNSKTGVSLSDYHKQRISEGNYIKWESMSNEVREAFREKMKKNKPKRRKA